MPATTDFLPFATAFGANVMAQADYAGAPFLQLGWVAGIAQSPQVNKAVRQGAFGSATLFNFVIQETQVDQPDDGNLSFAVTNLTNAFTTLIQKTSGHFYSYAGNPNGHVAGIQGVAGVSPPDLCEDTTNGHLYVCTTTGNAAAAVWALGAASGVTALTAGTGLSATPANPIVGVGTLSLLTASTTQLGGVKVDGSSITIASGVISSTNAGGNVVGPGSSTVGYFATWANASGTLLASTAPATAAQVWAGTDNAHPTTPLSLSAAGAFSTLTDAATVNWNWATQSFNAIVTLGGNRTIAAPTNLTDGRSFTLLVKQPGAGGPAVPVLNAFFNFMGLGAPSFSLAPGIVDTITGVYNAALGYAVCSFIRGS